MANKRKFEELFRFLSGKESKPERAILPGADRWELHPQMKESTTPPEVGTLTGQRDVRIMTMGEEVDKENKAPKGQGDQSCGTRKRGKVNCKG